MVRSWRHGWVVLALLVVAVLLGRAGLLGYDQPDLERYDGQSFPVARHIDGDTFRIAAPDGRSSTTSVRLWGVDTPETVRPNAPVEHYGPEAAAFTRKTVGQGPVRLRLVPGRTRDRYDRLLAYAYLPDGRMLNLVLIEEGFGWADPRFEHPHQAEFRQAMLRAERAGRGLWGQATNDDLPYYLRSSPQSR